MLKRIRASTSHPENLHIPGWTSAWTAPAGAWWTLAPHTWECPLPGTRTRREDEIYRGLMIITKTILEIPEYKYSRMGPKTLFELLRPL